jgi:cupin 2 domain-containing protein
LRLVATSCGFECYQLDVGNYGDHAWALLAIGRWKGVGISMTVWAGNLFADVADLSAANIGEEAFSEILARPGLKIERIISQGQTSPPGFWYDQAWNEWVIVLKGSATLQFEHEPAARALGAGITSSSLPGNATASSGRSRDSQRSGSPSISSERFSQSVQPVWGPASLLVHITSIR